MSFKVFLASSNTNKFKEASEVLKKFGIIAELFKCHLQEVQSNSLEEVAQYKAIHAYSLCLKPVIVEDDGLFINSLNGFPGPYSSFVYDTIGNSGILRLLSRNRNATFRSIIGYCEKENDVHLFDAEVGGKISKKIQGKKWGFDPIFIPAGQTSTFSQIKNKNMISHRYLALKKFANWYLRRQESNG